MFKSILQRFFPQNVEPSIQKVQLEEVFFYGFKFHHNDDVYDDLTCWTQDERCHPFISMLFHKNIFLSEGSFIGVFGVKIPPEEISTDTSGKKACSQEVIQKLEKTLKLLPPFLKMDFEDFREPMLFSTYIEKQ